MTEHVDKVLEKQRETKEQHKNPEPIQKIIDGAYLIWESKK